MSNELIQHKPAGALAPPPMSRALTNTIHRLRSGEADAAELFRPSYPVRVIEEAQRLSRVMDKRMAPASPDQIRHWLNRLAAATPLMERAEYVKRVEMIMFTSSDLPGVVWTEETMREAIRAFPRFFPAAGELDALLRRTVSPLTSLRTWVCHVARAAALSAEATEHASQPSQDGQGAPLETRPLPKHVEAVKNALAPFRSGFSEREAQREAERAARLRDVTLKGDHLAEARAARGRPETRPEEE